MGCGAGPSRILPFPSGLTWTREGCWQHQGEGQRLCPRAVLHGLPQRREWVNPPCYCHDNVDITPPPNAALPERAEVKECTS